MRSAAALIKRTIEISRQRVYVSARLDQLILQPFDEPKDAATSIPCEDVGVLVVDQPRTTYSHGALQALLRYGAAVVICGRDHLPAGMLLPVSDHTENVARLREQIAAGKPLCKRLWQQIVVAKIKAQAANLDLATPAHGKLGTLAKEVKSGDPANVEAQAAKVYWSAWLGDEQKFRRDTDGKDGLNAALNYGYAILRAAVGRALVAAGLHPALGVHHANRSNAFCLADDLLEPLRPMIDRRVRQLYCARDDHKLELDQPTKAHLLAVLTEVVTTGDQSGPLMVGLQRTVSSLVKCYRGEAKRLLLPVRLPGAGVLPGAGAIPGAGVAEDVG